MSRDDDRHYERMQEERRAEQRRQEQRGEERRAEERREEQRLQEQRRRVTDYWLNSFFDQNTYAPSSRPHTSYSRPSTVGPGFATPDIGKANVNASGAAKSVVGVVALAAAHGFLTVLKRSFAQSAAPAARAGSRKISVDTALLVGKWRGNRDAGIEFGIEFKSDGSYAYIVGEPGSWQLAHIGEYRVRPSRISGEWTNTVLALTPKAIVSPASGPFEQSALEARGLMDNFPHEYRVRFDPYDTKGEELFLLDVREHAQSTKDWSLYWQGSRRFSRPTP